MRALSRLSALLLLASATASAGNVYKWKDANGVTQYSEKPPTGQKYEGRLERIDDFMVTLTQADGTPRSFRRNGDVPKVDVRDPLEAHRNLLPVYTDKDIHDVTAYLAGVK